VTTPLPPLRIAIAPGVAVRKWTTRWAERFPDVGLEVVPVPDTDGVEVLRSHRATVSFVRLPVDRDDLSVIRLYSEVPVLVVSRDSVLAGRTSVSLAEVTGLPGVVDYPPVGDIRDAVALVAAGVGVLRLPFSVARFAARKDVVALPVSDAEEIEVAVCWLTDETTELIDQFIGIVRGRTAHSSR
jgi:DNA-binding transcriptional LysR family regulator